MAENTDKKAEETYLGNIRLTPRQAKFIEVLPKVGTIVEAGILAGYKHPHVQSYQVLKRLKHNPEFIGLMARAKLLPFTTLKKIRRGMDAQTGVYFEGSKVASEPNWQARARFTELAANISRLIPDRNQRDQEVVINITELVQAAVKVATSKQVEADYIVESPGEAVKEQGPPDQPGTNRDQPGLRCPAGHQNSPVTQTQAPDHYNAIQPKPTLTFTPVTNRVITGNQSTTQELLDREPGREEPAEVEQKSAVETPKPRPQT